MSSSNPFEGVQSQGPAQGNGQVTGVGSGVTFSGLGFGVVGVPSPGSTFTADTAEHSVAVGTVPATELNVGTTFKIDVFGYATQTAAALNLTGRVRIGLPGSSLTGVIIASDVKTTAAAIKTNQAFHFQAEVTVRTSGASGTIAGGSVLGGSLFDGGAASTAPAVTSPVAVDTTVAEEINVTLQSSAATLTAVNITNATIQVVAKAAR